MNSPLTQDIEHNNPATGLANVNNHQCNDRLTIITECTNSISAPLTSSPHALSMTHPAASPAASETDPEATLVGVSVYRIECGF